jgi:hypothetical protein
MDMEESVALANIENGMINYACRKTGQLLSVRIEPCIQTIIERYSSYSAIYVFPILISTDAEQSYNEYQIAINNYNRLLGKLSKMLPEVCNYHPIPLAIAGLLLQEITMFLFRSLVKAWATPPNRPPVFI